MSDSILHPNIPMSETDFDALFSQHANTAWGIAYVTTESVNAAIDAVADAFVEMFRKFEIGIPIHVTRFEIARMTRNAALQIMEQGATGLHAREPVSILGETSNRQATLALTALAEPMRTCLWLVEAEQFTTDQAAAVLQVPVSMAAEMLANARSNFRKYYGSQPEWMKPSLLAAIPPMPPTARQYVMETWDALRPELEEVEVDEPATKAPRSYFFTAAIAASAALAIVAVAASGIEFSSNRKAAVVETESTRLAAPPNANVAAPPNADLVTPPRTDDTSAVATPTFRPAAKVEPAPAQTPANSTTTTTQPKPAANPAAPKATPANTGTSPSIAAADNQLVDLPPAPASTTTTSTTSTTEPRRGQ